MSSPARHLSRAALLPAFFALVALFTAAPAALADEIVLKTGQIVPVVNPRPVGDSVMTEVKIGNSVGQIGYRINTIAKVRFPKPSELQAAADLLALGQASQALPLLDPIINFYGPLKDVPGNWWVPAALLKSSALEDLGRAPEAGPLLADLSRLATDPESALLAKVRLAALSAASVVNAPASSQPSTGPNKAALDIVASAISVYDNAIDKSEDSSVLAETWVDKGASLFATRDYEGALLAYLHVPVFFPNHKLLMSKALLGSARAYREIQDYKHARSTLDQLSSDYAASPESAAVADETRQLDLLEKQKHP